MLFKEEIDVDQTTEVFPTFVELVEEHSVTEPIVSIEETDEHMVSLIDGASVNDEPLKEEPVEKETEEPEVIEEHAEEIKEKEPVEKEQTAEKYKFVYDAVLNEKVTNDEVYHETMVPLVPNNKPATSKENKSESKFQEQNIDRVESTDIYQTMFNECNKSEAQLCQETRCLTESPLRPPP